MATLHVSKQGNDSNSGTPEGPFQTITRAYSHATPGDTVLVMPGVYTDYTKNWGLRIYGSGTASNPITLKSQVHGKAVIDGENANDRNRATYIDGSHNIIDGFEIRGGTNGGVTIYGNGNQILNCSIHHNGNLASTSNYGRDGVYSDKTTSGNVYLGNHVHDNGRDGNNRQLDHGLYLSGKDELAANNILARNSGSGIQVAGYETVRNMKIYNNVIAYNGTQGIMLWLDLDGVDIKNNILYGNASYGIGSWDAHGGGVVIDRNLVFVNDLGDYSLKRGRSDFAHTIGDTISKEPRFVDFHPAQLDAHLTEGSPAIGSGYNLSSSFTTDMDGAPRPLTGPWDIGVFNYGSPLTNLRNGLMTAQKYAESIQSLTSKALIDIKDGLNLTNN